MEKGRYEKMILEIADKNYDALMRGRDKLALENSPNKNIIGVKMKREQKLVDIFLSIGIAPHLQGYQFLKEAIKIVIEHPEYINSVTKQLYPKVAEAFATTACRVERGIRHALEVAFAKGKIVLLNKILGLEIFSKTEKPTNSEFIAIIADKLSSELK